MPPSRRHPLTARNGPGPDTPPTGRATGPGTAGRQPTAPTGNPVRSASAAARAGQVIPRPAEPRLPHAGRLPKNPATAPKVS